MTHTGRALIIGPIVVLALWGGAAAAAPAERTPGVEDPIAARPPAPAGIASMLTEEVGGPDMAPQTPQRSEAPRGTRGAPRSPDYRAAITWLPLLVQLATAPRSPRYFLEAS